MVPDIAHKTFYIHLGIVTPLDLLILYLVYRRWASPNSVIIPLLLIVANAIYNTLASSAPNAVFYSFTIPLVVIFGNIVRPLPFPFAAAFSAIAATGASWCVWMQPGLNISARCFATLFQVNIALLTLIATYRMERSERQAYLLTQREMLRGETLVEQNRDLSDLSQTDQLTGVPNRRAFDRSMERLWAEHRQSRTPLALLMIDIDHFKKLNDTYGHANGDSCLQKAAERLLRLMRPNQSLARYGGEEFAVLLEGESAFRAEEVGERFRSEIERMQVMLTGADNKPHTITISVGCATVIPRRDLSPGELFAAADKALYVAKHAGRNRVHVGTLEPQRDFSAKASSLVLNPTTQTS